MPLQKSYGKLLSPVKLSGQQINKLSCCAGTELTITFRVVIAQLLLRRNNPDTNSPLPSICLAFGVILRVERG